MARFLGTEHNVINCTYADIGKVMPEVVWHAEKPLIRTASAPMYLLSGLVRQKNIKVVLTGEGSDEMLGGYDLFKETKIRRFWSRNPGSKMRPMLLRRLYPYIPNWTKAPAYLEAYYRAHLAEPETSYYSHIPRWETTKSVKSFFSDPVKEALREHSSIDEFQNSFPNNFSQWNYLLRAQYLEIATLLSGNLLSSQGDRVAMAHAVEGRYPFLDYRIAEFCFSLPNDLKIKGLTEKYLLKQVAKPYLPDDVGKRVKQAYRSPDSESFFHAGKLDYIDELLSSENIEKSGCFNSTTVGNLVKKCKASNSGSLSTKYHMSVTGIVSTLLVDKLFIQDDSRIKTAGEQARTAVFKTEEIVN
jgi:asparagine synthase (glutamine-hydrolysing)